MRFFLEHKFVTLLIILGIGYWYVNPANRFGYYRKGFVIYNRIPLAFCDLYVDPNGDHTMLEDLKKKRVLSHWYSKVQDFTDRDDMRTVTLLIGNGFGKERSSFIEQNYISNLRNSNVKIVMLPSEKAVRKFNSLKDMGEPVAILLKLKM
ncbi:MAG: hypothetical protein GF401_04680 [Chitinivibrionales bacterium]|nr:hypothetical protein [Chitinivibrionales bacterium]